MKSAHAKLLVQDAGTAFPLHGTEGAPDHLQTATLIPGSATVWPSFRAWTSCPPTLSVKLFKPVGQRGHHKHLFEQYQQLTDPPAMRHLCLARTTVLPPSSMIIQKVTIPAGHWRFG